MVNVKSLKDEIIKRNQTVRNVADAIGIDSSTLYRKIKGGCDSLTVGEVAKIAAFLGLSSKKANEIFFGK